VMKAIGEVMVLGADEGRARDLGLHGLHQHERRDEAGVDKR